MAEIGIILATYNGEKYLREQLSSILQIHLKIMRSHICGDGSHGWYDSDCKKNMQRNIRRSRCGRMNKIRGITRNFLKAVSERHSRILCFAIRMTSGNRIRSR